MMRSLEFLQRERDRNNNPVRVGLIGVGATGRMIAMQLAHGVPGVRLAAIGNRTEERAILAFHKAGVPNCKSAASIYQLEDLVDQGCPATIADPLAICQAENIDLVIEVTGSVEFGARAALSAIKHRKNLVLVNAELDSTLGPVLKLHADRAGVVITNTDGDEPGVAMTLVKYLRGLGLRTVAAGNIKGMIDRYRTPDTQREFAAKYKQDAAKVTSFADGTKLSMETCVLANATGFRVGQRGMYGPKCTHVKEIASRLPAAELLNGGLVDYALGAEPHTGAFVVVFEDNPAKQSELAYYKLGDGPFYVFYTPFHLPHIQVASTIARAALHNDATVTPIGAPMCEVITVAKRDLKKGEILDGVGGFMNYGTIENAPLSYTNRFLPMGVSEGCTLVTDVKKDHPVSYDQVVLPEGRLCDELRAEQVRRFSLA